MNWTLGMVNCIHKYLPWPINVHSETFQHYNCCTLHNFWHYFVEASPWPIFLQERWTMCIFVTWQAGHKGRTRNCNEFRRTFDVEPFISFTITRREFQYIFDDYNASFNFGVELASELLTSQKSSHIFELFPELQKEKTSLCWWPQCACPDGWCKSMDMWFVDEFGGSPKDQGKKTLPEIRPPLLKFAYNMRLTFWIKFWTYFPRPLGSIT